MKKYGKLMMFFILAAWMMVAGCSSFVDSTRKKVLVINSYAENSTLYLDFHKRQIDILREEGIKADIKYIYLDCEKYREADEIERMRALVDSVTYSWKPELILVNDDQATFTLLKAELPMVRTVPVVFSGVNFPNKMLLDRYRNVTGVHDDFSIWENIKLIKDLYGEKIELFTLLDSTYLDMQLRSEIIAQLGTKPVTTILDVTDTTYIDTTHVDTTRTGSIYRKRIDKRRSIKTGDVLFESYRRRGDNGEGDLSMEVLEGAKGAKIYLQLKRDMTTEKVGFVNVNPSFTVIGEGFDRNEMLLGGFFSSVEMQMKQQANMAARILKGGAIESIPIEKSKKNYFIDWNVWRMLGKSDDVPPNYVTFVNRPMEVENPLRFYGTWAIIVGVITLLTLIFVLKQRSDKKKKERLVEELKAEKEVMELAIRGGGTYAWQVVDDKFVAGTEFWKELNVKTPATRLSDFVYYLEESAREEALQALGNLTTTGNRILQARCDFGLKGIFKWWEFRFITQRIAGKIRTMGLLLDIDQKKRYEDDMKRAREIAEKAELKHSFLTNISHEIRTPLNAIVGFTAVLHSGEELDEEEKKTCLESINENTEQLLSLVGDILDLSKFESGTMDMQLEKYNAKDLIQEIYDGFKKQISSRLEFRIQNIDVDAFITIDHVRFVQVINSFLSNASKFTTHGYVKLGCVIDESMQKLHFYVEDSGVGIKEEELKMIFTRFYKQDEFSKGTGLGLALSKVIVEKLDGKLQVVSKVGVGSRFIVTLPCWRILSNKELLG